MLFASNIEHCRLCVPGWGASVWTPPLTPCAPAKCQVSQDLSCLSISFVSLNASLYLSRCLYFLYRCPQFLYLSLYLSISLYTSLHLSMSLYISLYTPIYTIYLSIPLYISLHLSTPLYISLFTGTTCAAAPDGSGAWTCQYTFCLPDNMICDVTRQRL